MIEDTNIFTPYMLCLNYMYEILATNNEYIFGEHPLFGDALFKFVSTLVQTATHPRLILVPLVEYLGKSSSKNCVQYLMQSKA